MPIEGSLLVKRNREQKREITKNTERKEKKTNFRTKIGNLASSPRLQCIYFN